MKRTILDLLALQEVDMRLRELEKRYKSLPAERAELVAEFEVVRTALAKAENIVKKLELQIKSLEGDTAAKKAHLQDVRVQSGTVKKVSDYNNIMSEIATTEKAIADLEEQTLTAMDNLEKANVHLEKATRHYRATGRTVKKEVLELDALKETILKEVTEKSAESKLLEKKVAQTTLEIYKRLLASGKGEPVGKIQNGLCSNCSLGLPPMTQNEAKKGNLVHCDNCSCLLYDPEPAE